jgi:hypothetical protein
MDNLSNESSTNSSGFNSKSTTTTTFNNEYSPRLAEITDFTFSGRNYKTAAKRNDDVTVSFFFLSSGISPLYTSQYQMNV